MFKYFYLFFVLLISGCSGAPTHQESSNTELVVHYNGVEVHRRGKYLSEAQLIKLVEQRKEMVLIFSADWCNACTLTEKAIKQADLKADVYYLNIDEVWVQKLVIVLQLERLVPTMLHIDKESNILAKKVGPGAIVTYLLTKF